MNMSAYSKMTKNALIAEIVKLNERVAKLEEEKSELELMLEVTTDHANIFTEHLQNEKEDLEIMLEMTTEHSDALSQELIDQAEFIRETFGRYVNEEVVATLLDSPDGLVLGGEKCKATIMFTDLRGFTALSARVDPKEVVAFLNHYLEIMVKIILDITARLLSCWVTASWSSLVHPFSGLMMPNGQWLVRWPCKLPCRRSMPLCKPPACPNWRWALASILARW
jgi:hypothetical protein